MRISNKILLLPAFLLLGGVYTALTYSSSPPLSHTGAPGESDCSSCHGGFGVNSGPATRVLLLDGAVPSSYTPGQTYNVSLTVNRATRVKYGFQLKVEDGNGGDAGTLISTTNRTDLASGYIFQTWNGNTSSTSGTITWNFQWTAPPAGTGPVTFYYCSNAANNNGGSSGDEIYTNSLTVTEQSPSYQISGVLQYDNNALTPIVNSQVRLLGTGGLVLASATTNSAGQYTLTNIAPGSYTLTAQSNRPWGGVSASDALQISRHFSNLFNLNGLRLGAADVNATNSINTGDALLATRRYSGNISSFTAGDWRFESVPVNISSSSVNLNLKGICYGDVNGSFLPPVVRSSSVVLDGEVPSASSGDEVLVPLVFEKSTLLGSISLDLKIPEGWQGVGVESYLPGMQPDYLWKGNRLRLAWFDLNGWQSLPGSPFLALRLRPVPGQAGRLTLLPESEWTDPTARPLMDVTLRVGEVQPMGFGFALALVPGTRKEVVAKGTSTAECLGTDVSGRVLFRKVLALSSSQSAIQLTVPDETALVRLRPIGLNQPPIVLKMTPF